MEPVVLDISICNGKLCKHITTSIVKASVWYLLNELKCLSSTSLHYENDPLKIDTGQAVIFILLGTMVLAETWEAKLCLAQMKTAVLNRLYM